MPNDKSKVYYTIKTKKPQRQIHPILFGYHFNLKQTNLSNKKSKSNDECGLKKTGLKAAKTKLIKKDESYLELKTQSGLKKPLQNRSEL